MATKSKSPKKKSASKPKSAPTSKPKSEPRPPKSMAGFPKKTLDRLSGARQIGTRNESIPETLSLAQRELEREKVCDMLREIARVKEEHKTATAKAKAKITDLEEQKEIALRNANTGRRDVEIEIQEWLDKGNQVLRVRADTGEVIGDRTARVDELQEKLFEDDEPAGDDDEDEDEDENADDNADKPGDDASDAPAPPSDPDGDFGDAENP